MYKWLLAIITVALIFYSIFFGILKWTDGIGSVKILSYDKSKFTYHDSYNYDGYGKVIGKGSRPYWYNQLLSPLTVPGQRILGYFSKKNPNVIDPLVEEEKKYVVPYIKINYGKIEINTRGISLPPDAKYIVCTLDDEGEFLKAYILDNDNVLGEW